MPRLSDSIDGEIAVTSIALDARGLDVASVRNAPAGDGGAAVMTGSAPTSSTLNGAVDRSHTTPTPDPDPRDSGRRTSGALRLSELASRAARCRRAEPRACTLRRGPTSRTALVCLERTPLGSARPTPTASACAAMS